MRYLSINSFCKYGVAGSSHCPSAISTTLLHPNPYLQVQVTGPPFTLYRHHSRLNLHFWCSYRIKLMLVPGALPWIRVPLAFSLVCTTASLLNLFTNWDIIQWNTIKSSCPDYLWRIPLKAFSLPTHTILIVIHFFCNQQLWMKLLLDVDYVKKQMHF